MLPVDAVFNYITEPNPMGQPFLEALAGERSMGFIPMERMIKHVVNGGIKGARAELKIELSEDEKADLLSRVTEFQATVEPSKKVTTIFV